MSFWGTQENSQRDLLAIKPVTPDGNLFGHHRREEERQEEKPPNQQSSEEEPPDLFSHNESVELHDEPAGIIKRMVVESAALLASTEEESPELFHRIWQEALGSAFAQAGGALTGIPAHYASLQGADPLELPHCSEGRQGGVSSHRHDCPNPLPWVLAFPGASLLSESCRHPA